jgi:hypothetical protein
MVPISLFSATVATPVGEADNSQSGGGGVPQHVPLQQYVRRRTKQKANRVKRPKKRVRFAEGMNIPYAPSRECEWDSVFFLIAWWICSTDM